MSLIFVNHGDSASLVVVGLKIRQLNLESLMGIFYGDCTGADSTTNTPKAPIIHQLIDRSTHGCQRIEDIYSRVSTHFTKACYATGGMQNYT